MFYGKVAVFGFGKVHRFQTKKSASEVDAFHGLVYFFQGHFGMVYTEMGCEFDYFHVLHCDATVLMMFKRINW